MFSDSYVILLTATINPGGTPYTHLQNISVREKHYLDAIDYYLTHTKFKIVFCNNSGEDISSKITGDKNRIEFLSFYGNDLSRVYGKGYGEFMIIQYAFQHSEFIKKAKYVIKITGRLIIQNISIVLKLNDLLLFNPKRKVYYRYLQNLNGKIDSRCFVGSKQFFDELVVADNLINDSQHYYFEHYLYDLLLKNKKSFSLFTFCLPLSFRGVSGSTGDRYDSAQLSFIQIIMRIIWYMLSKKRRKIL